ncbi:MAG TPA: alkaline phosphatase family protein [Bacteroides sp.]|nr:alkaline phosphatase family protein [Bacteroides sp.]
MKIFVYAFVLTVLSFTTGLKAQNRSRIPSEKPKLIVNIVVDQMRYDFIHRYWDKFGEGGIRKLVGSGTFCKNASYNYLINETAVGHSTIATGALPSNHGIISNNWYNSLRDEVVYCVEDEKVHTVGGSYESGLFSPRNLLASTIGDEINLASNFRSKVVGLALDNSAAILAAGHSADYAFWYDDETGNWVSSSYYVDSLPRWAREFNEKRLPESYLTRTWEPMLPLSEYTESSNDTSAFEIGLEGRSVFPYDLDKLSTPKRNERDYGILKYTPFGNVLTRDFATAIVINEEMGKDEFTDYLAIGFSANEYIGKYFGSNSVEVQDAMLRLDREIAHFIDFIDQNVGIQNTLIILTSDHGLAYSPAYLKSKKIPSGDFNPYSSLSLLGSYLNAIYGKGDWIRYYYGQQIYLNHELIESSGISYQEIQERTAQFLIQFEGVSNAVTSYTLQTSNFSEGIFHKMQNGYHQKRSGDVIINLAPGWIEKINGDSYHSSYLGDNHVPLIWYGWKIKRSTLTSPVKMIDIAPTISYFLDIARPNVSTGDIILELVN